MILEFRIHKLKEDSHQWKHLKKHRINNEFIVVGEVEEHKNILHVVKVLNIDKAGYLKIYDTFKLDEMTFRFEKNDLISTEDFAEFDMPIDTLTIEIVENILKFNQGEVIKLDDVLLRELALIKIPE